jgi:hypothetical protein
MTIELKRGEQSSHIHPEAGYFQVRHMLDHPVGLPFFCNGRYYATEQAAVVGFHDQCEEQPEDNRWTWKRAADHIDGFDRDDLDESPDF